MSSFDIVLPCFNPLPGWSKIAISSYVSLKRNLGPNVELTLIVVNDGSTNGEWENESGQLEKAIPNLVIKNCPINLGKGSALRAGVSLSKSPFCIFTDIDFPYKEANVVDLYNSLTSEHAPDIVIGQRPERYYLHVPFARRVLSKSFRSLLRIFYGLSFKDTQCGLKGFNRNGREVFLQTQTNRYLIDLEFLLHASKQRLRIAGLLVELRPEVIFTKLGFTAIAKEIGSLIAILYRVLVTKAIAREA